MPQRKRLLLTANRRPRTAGLFAAAVAAIAVGWTPSRPASAEEPVETIGKRFQKFARDASTVYKKGVVAGSKAAEKAGDRLRRFPPAVSKAIDTFIRNPIRDRATRDIPANAGSSRLPKLSMPKRDLRPNVVFRPGRPTLRPYDPREFASKRDRVRRKTIVPSPVLPAVSRRSSVVQPRFMPISKPKGVLMRLGIDPKTYRKGKPSQSLLHRIRSRS